MTGWLILFSVIFFLKCFSSGWLCASFQLLSAEVKPALVWPVWYFQRAPSWNSLCFRAFFRPVFPHWHSCIVLSMKPVCWSAGPRGHHKLQLVRTCWSFSKKKLLCCRLSSDLCKLFEASREVLNPLLSRIKYVVRITAEILILLFVCCSWFYPLLQFYLSMVLQ